MPRWMHRLRAFWGGYFWLPCKLCGRKYGGHESSATLYDSWNHGQTVCINCKDEADRRNKEFFKNNPSPMRLWRYM